MNRSTPVLHKPLSQHCTFWGGGLGLVWVLLIYAFELWIYRPTDKSLIKAHSLGCSQTCITVTVWPPTPDMAVVFMHHVYCVFPCSRRLGAFIRGATFIKPFRIWTDSYKWQASARAAPSIPATAAFTFTTDLQWFWSTFLVSNNLKWLLLIKRAPTTPCRVLMQYIYFAWILLKQLRRGLAEHMFYHLVSPY